ncbi:DUF192 domain-containing protein [Candidatus Parcubacteria bacterium]|uniref:DUF192 domain-containing protein n=1 Tax=Candidatus Kaiserbacteria bacterium CG10_big_fil_rev_8_21_14_0_10_47_16 TaxID=1974608 RepID=A0A2H0UEF6_9BACT|nr:DUF192 domain-containing protein [Candidatus Parcubacteria bacterium]PIR84782.1 MAG: hypothetical protein COU16_01180 [Candidatus Kaiserbacteria bacterium CG10_big_fil_rev_8_21_14_0_10_47_16]
MKRTGLLILSGIILIVLLAILFIGRAAEAPQSENSPFLTLQVGDASLSVEVVTSASDLQKGLGGRTSIGDADGMLFVFPKENYYGFWMEDMQFAIDIIWITGEGSVVYIADNVTPESYPHVYKPASPALYVLEVPAGDAARFNIATATDITIPHISR